MQLLHVIATPRSASSNTLAVADAFIDGLCAGRSDVEVEVVDLFNVDLPAIAGDNIEAKYTLMMGQPIDRNHQDSWRQIELLIERFLRADVYVISAPMWNLGVPYALKYYIDSIVQPGYLFRYDDTGQIVPLVHGKKMLCVSARGSDYSVGTYMHAYDFHQPYLRAIFGVVGITDIEFLDVQPTDVTPDLRALAIAEATQRALALAASTGWLAEALPADHPAAAILAAEHTAQEHSAPV